MRKLFVIASTLALCSPIHSLSAEPMAELAVEGFGDLIGSWSLSDAWQVELRGSDQGERTCIAISPVGRAGQERFRFALYFGDRSGAALINDRQILDLKQMALEMADSGYDLNAIEVESRDSIFRYFNSLSRSMTTKLIGSLHQTEFVLLEANGPYLFSFRGQADATREAMRKCEDFRIGRVLPD